MPLKPIASFSISITKSCDLIARMCSINPGSVEQLVWLEIAAYMLDLTFNEDSFFIADKIALSSAVVYALFSIVRDTVK